MFIAHSEADSSDAHVALHSIVKEGDLTCCVCVMLISKPVADGDAN